MIIIHLRRHILSLFIITGICIAFISTGNTQEPASRPEIFCTLSVAKNPAVIGQQITTQVEVINNSEKTIAVLWPEDTHLLLTWGSLQMTIRDSNGINHSLVPLPSPAIQLQQNHYLMLYPDKKVIREVNVCWFRDKNYSNSPCSKTGRYTIDAIYINNKDTYWDSSQNKFIRIDAVWKGKAKCTPVTLDIVDDQSSEKRR